MNNKETLSKKLRTDRVKLFTLLKMTVEQSKRQCFLTLTFLVKSVSKNLLIHKFSCKNKLLKSTK